MLIIDRSNDARFERYCRNGTKFAARNDLDDVQMWNAANGHALLQDVAEFVGYHAVHILPHLDGFKGYDGLTFAERPTQL